MKKFLIAAIVVGTVAAAMAASVAPSRVHPGNFPINQTPQFVCLGSDDNYYPDGLNWIVKYIESKTNPTTSAPKAGTFDGKPATMSFYPNTFNSEWYDIVDTTSANQYGGAIAKTIQHSLKEAMAHGFEIGSHTKHHMTEATSPFSYWFTEIDSSLIDFVRMKISRDTIVGFRTPFLQYNNYTFKALDSLKTIRYDCSIESGLDSATIDGTNFVWPYTLDNGPFVADTESEVHYDSIAGGTTLSVSVKVGKHPGLWETPVYCVIVPPALRHQIWLQRKDTIAVYSYHLDADGNIIDSTLLKADSVFEQDFDTTTGKITGLDYNMWSAPANGGFGMDSAQFLATMKYSLDQRLANNRAPFCFGMHSNIFYDDQGFIDESAQQYGSMTSPPRATVTQMRNAMENFITYALSKPAVRLITQRELIKWCANPVALTASGTVPGSLASPPDKNINIRVISGIIAISGLPAGVKTTASLYTISGRCIAQANVKGATLRWQPVSGLAAGSYLVRLNAPGFNHLATIVIE
jgi:hypothetical protein